MLIETFYRKIRFIISDLIRFIATFHNNVHHRIFEILYTFAEHVSREFYFTEFLLNSKKDSMNKISCFTTRTRFIFSRMNFEQF